MISLQIEVAVYEDDIQEWCLENGYNYDIDDLDDFIGDFVEDFFSISPDSVRVL